MSERPRTPRPRIGITVGDPPATTCVNDRFDTFKATTGSGTDRAITNDDITSPDLPDLASSEVATSAELRPARKSVAARSGIDIHLFTLQPSFQPRADECSRAEHPPDRSLDWSSRSAAYFEL